MRRREKRVIIDENAPAPITASVTRTVRFQEVDLMRVVWHGRYSEYFEEGRCAVGKLIGLDYPDFFREEIMAPIVRFEIDFESPLQMGDTFRVETSMIWSEAVRLDHLYVIKRESDGRIAARGSTTQLLIDYEGKLLMVWPEYFKEIRKKWKNGEWDNKNG